MYLYAIPRSSGLADALFTKTRQRVLGVLFGHPRRSFSVSEIMWRVATGAGAVHRLLETFERAGLVTSESCGNQRQFQANRNCPIFVELCGIAVKTVGIADPLREALLPLRDRIIAAFVTTGENDHGIWLVIVASGLGYQEALDGMRITRDLLSRDVWFDLFDRDEWLEQRWQFQGPKIFLLGDESCLL